jgi:hypothetical protein
MGLPGIAWLISLARNATDEVQRRHANRSFETNGGNRPSLFFLSDHRAQSTCAEGMTGTLVVDLTVTSSVAKNFSARSWKVGRGSPGGGVPGACGSTSGLRQHIWRPHVCVSSICDRRSVSGEC